MKKIITLLCTALCANVLWAQTTFTIGNLTYTVIDSMQVKVSSCVDTYDSIVIPTEVTNQRRTYSVTTIGHGAFEDCWLITSISLPNSIRTIEANAFKSCVRLSHINIPNSVTTIGSSAFEWCVSLDSISLPDSLTYIASSLFRHCSFITTFSIPNSVTHICDSAFERCHNLAPITIPNSVTSIGNYAFSSCSRLTSITIPNSVTSIGDNAFSSCGLTSITIPNSVTSISSHTFSNCTHLSSVTIPNSVTSIESSAFSDCSGLTSITIPNSVTSIGDNVFSGCGLTSITIPNSVTLIGNSAFYDCRALTSITLPDSLITISDSTFQKAGLTSITIPNSVVSIGDNAFSNCTALTSISLPNSLKSIGKYAFSNCSGLDSITLPDSISSISSCTFMNCTSLTSVTMGNKITSIGTGAFYSCSSLSSITFSESITNIDGYAFGHCISLTSITLPPKLTTIKNFTFESCTGLVSITLLDSISYVESRPFRLCNNLQEMIVLPTTPPDIGRINNTNPIVLKVRCESVQAYTESIWNDSYFFNCSSIQVAEETRYNFELNSNNPEWGTTEIEYDSCNVATITALPDSGYLFYSWSDGNTENPRTVFISNDTSFMAIFMPRYTIEVLSNSDSMGTVRGGGIFDYETRINISATPFSGYKFIGWNDGNMDNPRSIVVVNDSTFVANFAPKMRYTLTVSSEDESKGLTIGGGEFEEQTGTNIGAVPRDGYHFKEWSDGDTNRMRHIVLVCDSVLIARFERNVVGIESADALSNLTFYPNPTSATITFNRTDIKKIEVLDAVGRTAAVYENSHIIDLSKLSKGYYTMRITTAEGVAVRKVIRK